MEIKDIVRCISRGEKEFSLTYEFYNSLPLEIQKEIDRNYWRFGMPKCYLFTEMLADEKAHFAAEEMVIHHSIFELT